MGEVGARSATGGGNPLERVARPCVEAGALEVIGEADHERASGAGAGFRLTSGRAVSLQMDYGHVVDASNPSQKGEGRLHASFAVSY